jgi:5,10-methenyltetrahydrofolate synthetase
LPKTQSEFRNWAKEKLLEMSEEKKAKESEKLLQMLLSSSVLKKGCIAAFYPTELEPQIIPFLSKLATEGRLMLPRVLNNQKMEFVLVQNLAQDLQIGAFGIMEPNLDLPAFQEAPAAFLIPGIVFGKDGGRIGRGAGYYDRYLSLFKGIPRLGVAYSVQIKSTLPQNAMDMRMDEVFWVK